MWNHMLHHIFQRILWIPSMRMYLQQVSAKSFTDWWKTRCTVSEFEVRQQMANLGHTARSNMPKLKTMVSIAKCLIACLDPLSLFYWRQDCLISSASPLQPKHKCRTFQIFRTNTKLLTISLSHGCSLEAFLSYHSSFVISYLIEWYLFCFKKKYILECFSFNN